MIKTKFVEVELSVRNAKKTIKNYDLVKELKPGDIAKIPISKLAKHSRLNVEVCCDYCGKLFNVPFKRYNLSTKDIKKVSCSNKECSNQKIKDVCQYKYGVDNPFQDKKVKSKIKRTMVDKYGVEHPMHLESTKDKIKKTSLEKYGVDSYVKTDEYREKTIKTNLEKYGVEYSMQNKEVREKSRRSNKIKYGVQYNQQSPIVRQKTIETNLKKYGVECNLQSEDTKNKIKETNLKNLGVENPFMSNEIKENIKKSNLEKWGHEHISLSEKFRMKYYKISNHKDCIKYIGDGVSLFSCDKGHNFEIKASNYRIRVREKVNLCTICNPISDFVSIKEKELYLFLKSIYNGKILQSYRDSLEIDIYLPELNIGFEFNGLYWHSEEYKDKDYHLNKTRHFKDRGIRIIHIWEDDWDNKRNILKSKIKNWLSLFDEKIWAKECNIEEIKDSRIATKFLNENHIQGRVNSTLKIGLFHEKRLVSLMTFDHFESRKKMLNNDWVINRFCDKLNTEVVGGASKLLKYFLNVYNPSKIISYSDKGWSDKNLYRVLGFNKLNESKPDYKYVINGQRKHKLNYETTENDFMSKNNIYKIWDSGKIKYEYKKNP